MIYTRIFSPEETRTGGNGAEASEREEGRGVGGEEEEGSNNGLTFGQELERFPARFLERLGHRFVLLCRLGRRRSGACGWLMMRPSRRHRLSCTSRAPAKKGQPPEPISKKKVASVNEGNTYRCKTG
jgi:hypothetical protein